MSQANQPYEDDDAPATGNAQEVGDDLDGNPPAGFESKGGDLKAYWEPASQGTAKKPPSAGSPPVLFTPLHVTLSDSKRPPNKGEAHKSSTLIHCRLERRCRLRSAEKSEGYQVFEKGTLFGIWSKPGMRQLAGLAGVQVWMKNDGFRDVGKDSDMIMFDIKWEKDGEKLKVLEDHRVHSLPAKLKEARAQVADNLGDIPF